MTVAVTGDEAVAEAEQVLAHPTGVATEVVGAAISICALIETVTSPERVRCVTSTGLITIDCEAGELRSREV